MAHRQARQIAGQGPGNKVIATTLLESLAVRGQMAARDRASRALGLADIDLVEKKKWLPDDAVARMFVAAETDASFARAVGHRLIEPDATGIPLYGLGLATPEKAYRRAGSLLPRSSVSSSWIVEGISSCAADLHFIDRPAADVVAERAAHPQNRREQASLCALRVGMLEAIPGLYGLLPANVSESTCLAKGDDACRYAVTWERTSRIGIQIGGGLGLGFAAAVVAVAVSLGLPVSASVFPALCSLVFGSAVGLSFDLSRQLDAVAGSRRGHLALFDQVDDALASKLDALARADAKLEGDEPGYRADRSPAGAGEGRPATALSNEIVVGAMREIHSAAGDLECWFEQAGNAPGAEASRREGGEGDAAAPRELVRKIRDGAARMATQLGFEAPVSQDGVDLVALLTRAIAVARPQLPRTTIIEVDHDANLRSVPCEPVQIEEVVVQLLRNAVDASRGLTESPEVMVSLRNVSRGVELAVEDRGVGIEATEIDEVFDPFFGEKSAGLDEGFGLPVCLRIVERHGGELRIETEDRPGTRVSILLPESSELPA